MESLALGTRPQIEITSIPVSSLSPGSAPSDPRIRTLTFQPASTGDVAWLLVAFVHTSPICVRPDRTAYRPLRAPTQRYPRGSHSPYPAGRDISKRKPPTPPQPSTSMFRHRQLSVIDPGLRRPCHSRRPIARDCQHSSRGLECPIALRREAPIRRCLRSHRPAPRSTPPADHGR